MTSGRPGSVGAAMRAVDAGFFGRPSNTHSQPSHGPPMTGSFGAARPRAARAKGATQPVISRVRRFIVAAQEEKSLRGLRGELAQDVLQDPAVTVVVALLRRIDTHAGFERDRGSLRRSG